MKHARSSFWTNASVVPIFLNFFSILVAGDAQSVSALADLAKQAQVFNLQNWLHSAEAKSGSLTFPLYLPN